jgi:hypothetical protein
MTDEPGYTIKPARYAKNMMAVHCASYPNNWMKTRAMCLAGRFSNERYSHREKAYIMSKTAATKFEKAWKEGWKASPITGRLYKDENQFAVD